MVGIGGRVPDLFGLSQLVIVFEVTCSVPCRLLIMSAPF